MLRALFVILVALAAAGAALPAAASGFPERYALAGAETHATGGSGEFVGGALRARDDPMFWKAVVRHRSLSRDPARAAQITGGTLTLRFGSDGGVASTRGTFTGGTVTYDAARSAASACGRQVFQVDATVANLRRDGLSATGTLEVYLTHHRRTIFGRCITYAATVNGSLSLSF
jgi:hypothetical protein